MKYIMSYRRFFQESRWYDLLFFGPYLFFVIINFLLTTTLPLPSVLAPISKLPLAFVLIKIFLDSITRLVPTRKLVGMIILLVISGLVLLFGQQAFPLYYAILTAGAHNISAKKVMRVHFKFMAISLIVVALLSLVGIIENRVFYRSDQITARLAFGIQYPTDFSALVVFLTAIGVSLYKKHFKIAWFILTLTLAYFLATYVDARLDTILLVVIGLYLLVSELDILKSITLKFSKEMILMMTVLSFLFAVFYLSDHSLMLWLNNLLSGRLELAHSGMWKFGVKLFGAPIEFNGYGDFNQLVAYNFIDNTYMNMLIRFGIVYTIYSLACYVVLHYRTAYRLDDTWVFYIAFTAIHGFITHHMINPIYNPAWILFFALPFDKAENHQYKLTIVGQLGDPKTGLGKALNDVVDYAKKTYGKNKVQTVDIINNKLFVKHLWHLLTANTDSFYFTPAGSLGGNLRDLVYLKMMTSHESRVVLHFHNNHYGQVINQYSWLKYLNRKMLEDVECIILLGTGHKAMFEGLNIADEKFIFISNGVDEDLFITEEAFHEKNRNNIIYFSNMLPEKGYQHLLDASYLINPKYRITFSGKFYNEELENEFLEAIKYHSNIQYIPGVYGENKKALLEKMAVFILPTEYKDETLPISMLEAMASGLYIITTPRGVIPETLIPKTSTILSDTQPETIAHAIESVSEALSYNDFQIDKLSRKYNKQVIMQQILATIKG